MSRKIEIGLSAIDESGDIKLGKDDVGNKAGACAPCGLARVQLQFDNPGLEIEEFRSNLQRQFELMLKDNPYYKKALRFGQIEETGTPIIFYFEMVDMANKAPNT